MNYLVIREPRLDFIGQSYATVAPNLHKYPATMIPQIGIEILKELNINQGALLDPYCGSGSSFVSALSAGINTAEGYDINPLAILICKAKFQNISPSQLKLAIKNLRQHIFESLKETSFIDRLELNHFNIKNFSYWFSKEIAQSLQLIKYHVDRITNETIKNFIQVAFSETVRETSYTRINEFKLYRVKETQTLLFNPDAYGIFFDKLEKNQKIYESYYFPLIINNPKINLFNFSFPKSKPNNFDVVLTSPPYGDSRTTVAYGQFSYFANAWMGIPNANQIDSQLMGGKKSKKLYQNSLISEVIQKINDEHPNRAHEVSSFYEDLADSIERVAPSIRRGGFAAYITGNRKVKGLTLPTDQFIAEQFEKQGFQHLITYERLLSNKRMPKENSPSNIKGKKENTMLYEYVVICQH